MRDSFFSGRNGVDRQLDEQEPSADSCQALIEASLRRIVQLEGTMAAAVRMQRLADICAAENVRTIEHWRMEVPRPRSEPKPARRQWSLHLLDWYSAGGCLLGLACIAALWWQA